MRVTALVIGMCMTAALLYGCGQKTQQPAPTTGQPGGTPATGQAAVPGQPQPGATAEQLLEQWKQLASTATRENPLLEETSALADQIIAQQQPQLLLSLLDLVEDPQSTPYVKVLATLSVTKVVGPHTAPRLIEMTKPEKDGTTRACATNMLRHVQTEEVTGVLRQLKTDSEPRVRLYALIGLALRDPKERQEIHAYWRKPETTLEEKGTIIDVLSQIPVPEDVALMEEAATAMTLSEGVRLLAVASLGLVGAEAQVAFLTNCSQNDPSERIRTAAKDALSQVNARMGGKQQLQLPMN